MKYRRGFTIVELLIVIVIIAILAAITVVAYNGIQNRANDTAVKNDLNALAKQAALFHAIEARYPSPAEFFNGAANMNISVSNGSYSTSVYNLYYCSDRNTYERFGIAARSKSGQTFTISSNSGITAVSSSPSWESSCGAFGGTVLADIIFTWGYDIPTAQWRYGL